MNLPPTGPDRIGFYCPTARDVYRRRGEKPWKPNPPKRSVSLMKSDAAVAPPVDGRRNQWRRRGGYNGGVPGYVSVVPIDTTTSRRQRTTENDPQLGTTSSSGGVRSTLTSNSASRDLPVTHLYADHEHGFNGRQNLNLRGKSPSRDRWSMTSGSNHEPYLYEDDFYRLNSKNSNKKPDAGVSKTRQRASFLLCASRKSIKTCPSDDLRPFQKTTNRSESPTLYRANGTNLPQIKPHRISSANNSDTNFEKQSTGHVAMMSQRQCFIPSRVPVGNNVEKPSLLLATPSDHSNFFPSVATLRRQHTTFWAGPGTGGRARPVSTPQLLGPVPTTQIPGPIATIRHPRNPVVDLDTCRPTSVVDSPRRVFMDDLNEEGSGPCSIRFISETSYEQKSKYPRYEIPILQSASSERKTEGTSGGSLCDGKARNQPQELLPNLRQKAFSVSVMSDSHEARFYPSNSQSFANAGNGIPVKAQNLPFDSFELSNSSQNFPFGNQDGSSLRSSSTSDWFSARDCTSSSICVESINSDPVNSECDSDRRSTTWISKVKKVFDSVWAMLMPASTAKKQLSVDTDALSDVDSGCNVEADQDLFVLQRSPSENSELQKLAALVDKIAKDRKNRKEPFDVSFGRYPSDVSFHEPSYFLASSGSRAGSPRDLECISEVAEESLHQQNGHHRSSGGEDPSVAAGQNGGSSLLVENSWRNSNSSSCATPFDASHKSLPGNVAWFVSNAPFAESSKVHKDCGKSERVKIENLKIGCKDILDDRKCTFHDEKSGNTAVKLPSNARKYWSVKSETSSNEDEKSNCGKDIYESTAFGRDECLMHEQLSLLTEFSVSPELDKAIEMLTVSSDSIQVPSRGLPLFPTSFKDKSRAEAKHILQHDLQKPCNPCSSSVYNDTDDIRREGVMNSISTKKHITFSKNIQHGSSVPASPENSPAENPYSLTMHGGVSIKVFPATNPTLVENFTKELESSGENTTSPAKQNLATPSKTNLQNCGSLKPQTKANSNSLLESEQNKSIALKNVQNQSKYFSKPLSSEPKCNQFTGASVSHFHNSTSPNRQMSNCLVQHSTALGNRICNGLPSPTVQRTRASKIAFLARQ